jgi:ubiquinone/menaquinone biosynthesis C-methylase UbiE
MQKVVQHLGPRINRAADLGCGFGDWAVLIANRHLEFYLPWRSDDVP